MARQARVNPAMRWVDDRLHIAGVINAALSHIQRVSGADGLVLEGDEAAVHKGGRH